ncbi:MAG TPA: sigma 54-interacting transcriptional regulator [Terriglobia bacterium]|nr:sigma 54-interacting transcriptional regulator [Terriglobia bacterium]
MIEAAAGVPNARSESSLERHRALLEVAETISQHRDLPGLFHSLAELLEKVVLFDSLIIVLHNAETGQMRLHALEGKGEIKKDFPSLELPVEDSPGGMVWRTQQSFLFSREEMEARFPRIRELVRQRQTESVCMLPLTTAQRRLGAMGFGSSEPGAYNDADLEFLTQVARQVAVAVDNALNYARIHAYQGQLGRERDHLEALLEITNALVSNLDLRELFPAISACLRRVVKHDYAGLCLLEPDQERLRLCALDFPGGKGLVREEMIERIDRALPGQAVITRKPYVAAHEDILRFRQSEMLARHLEEGLKCAVFIPLISRDRVLGTLNVASLQPDAFSQEDIDLLVHAANPIAIAVENALAYSQIASLKDQLAEEKLYLEDEIRTEHDFEEIIGESPALRRALKQLETVAPTGSTVLILGETGTGKELIARAIHNLGQQREKTFVKLNCAAIPSGLLESELFGHERGAFTGAISQKIGRFELAHRGTLFLDEIGDIPLELQPKLLRVLQEQEFERLGGTQTIRVEVRLVAATNQDLARMVEEHRFRSDLFYRLNVFPLSVPPLRERPEDIPLLVRYFAQKYSRRMNKKIETIPAESMETLSQYHWPGNVRELENLIERAVILSQNSILYLPPAELKPTSAEPPVPAQTLEEAEREHILRVLRETNWVIGGPRGAAVRLGMKRTTLQSRMRRLDISRAN